MKRVLLTFCAAGFLFAGCNNSDSKEEKTSSSDTSGTKMEKMDDNSKKEQAWIPIDDAMEAKGMQDAATLGEPHKMLAKGNGTWAADMTFWRGIDSPAMKMSGTQVTSSILEGHYQQSKFAGKMMGMPFEGISTVGYDNTTKQYVSTWVDNMGTGIMTMTGSWNDGTKSLTLTCKHKNPGNGLECTEREVYKVVDDNSHVMEMYGPDPKTGKEYKMIEIKYTRKK
jgi:hypothetical protein